MRVIYKDLTASCVADVSDIRDLKTIESRVESEGISFLTITLPAFCADFEKSLEAGFIDPKSFRNFKKLRAIPHFLKGMLGLLFDIETGRLYEQNFIAPDDSAHLVRVIRQLCLTFKKVEIPCAPSRERKSLDSFVQTELSFQEFLPSEEDESYFRALSFVLWSDMLRHLRLDMLSPKHGPGATAEHVSGNRKYQWLRWHERLENYFPIIGNGYTISVDSEQVLEGVKFIPEDEEQPVRVVLVPKTLKGPRIIAVEPVCMQYVQQGIRECLYDLIESNWPTAGHVNFRDQSINQKLAMIGSSDGSLATVDLSDASDRVPRDLALAMFDSHPDLRDAIDACRSTKAELPDGTIIGPLRKFASMGSALCFPVESMYFYTICVGALLRALSLPVTRSGVNSVRHMVHVYGDDIIVPTAYATIVLDHLRLYNCKVNHSKTFMTGKFRESCGADVYDGSVVTPTYIRTLKPENKQQASRLLSYCATAHQFYLRGMWNTAQLLYESVEKVVGFLPYVPEESACLGRKSFLGFRSFSRWNGNLQRLEVRAWCPTPVYRTDELDGYGALMKSFQRLREPSILPLVLDRDHLLRSALHGEVALKRRWVPAT
jgi:hypothetical protein